MKRVLQRAVLPTAGLIAEPSYEATSHPVPTVSLRGSVHQQKPLYTDGQDKAFLPCLETGTQTNTKVCDDGQRDGFALGWCPGAVFNLHTGLRQSRTPHSASQRQIWEVKNLRPQVVLGPLLLTARLDSVCFLWIRFYCGML